MPKCGRECSRKNEESYMWRARSRRARVLRVLHGRYTGRRARSRAARLLRLLLVPNADDAALTMAIAGCGLAYGDVDGRC